MTRISKDHKRSLNKQINRHRDVNSTSTNGSNKLGIQADRIAKEYGTEPRVV